MGKIAMAAKVAHVPPMLLRDGAAEAGHRDIARRARVAGVDTVVVFDSLWRTDLGYGVNCNVWLEGVAAGAGTPYAQPGNRLLGHAIAEAAARRGVPARVHAFDNPALGCGTLVPMQAMNADQHFKVVVCAADLGSCPLEDSRTFGAGVREAIVASGSLVMVLASGSLSRGRDTDAEAGCSGGVREFDRQVDLRMLELWRQAEWRKFCAMLPDYAGRCGGDGGMHDTAMLLGLLGWDEHDRGVEMVTAYFTCARTGAVNAIFPVD